MGDKPKYAAAAASAARLHCAHALVVIMLVFGLEWAQAQSSCSNGPYATALIANLTVGTYNTTSFPGPALAECTSCGSYVNTTAYVYSGKSANGNLNSVLNSPNSAFPYLQCLSGGGVTCLCNSTKCYNLVGGVPGVYLVPYCPASNASACQIYGVLDCFVSGTLTPSSTKYFNGVNTPIRYTCSEQVFANNSTWASLTDSGVFPLITYVKCGTCPPSVPAVSPGSCGNYALLGSTTTIAPTTSASTCPLSSQCVRPGGASPLLLDTSSVQVNTSALVGKCSCTGGAGGSEVLYFYAGVSSLVAAKPAQIYSNALACLGGSGNSQLCVVDTAGAQWTPIDGNLISLLLAPFCGQSGCYPYLLPVCSVATSGMKNSNSQLTCQTTMQQNSSSQQLLGSGFSAIQATSIDCNGCTHASSYTPIQCYGPVVTYTGVATSSACTPPSGTAMILLDTSPPVQTQMQTSYSIPFPPAGQCNCSNTGGGANSNNFQFQAVFYESLSPLDAGFLIYETEYFAYGYCSNITDMCVCDESGDCWVAYGGNLHGVIFSPYCDAWGCHFYVSPYCKTFVDNPTNANSGLANKANGQLFTCEQSYTYFYYENLPVGYESPYIKAVSIDCANCSHAQSMSFYECNGTYEAASPAPLPACIIPEGTSVLHIAGNTATSEGISIQQVFAHTQFVGWCNCSYGYNAGATQQELVALKSFNQTAAINTSLIYSLNNVAVTCAGGGSPTDLCFTDYSAGTWTSLGSTLISLLLAPYCDYTGCFTYVIPVCSNGASPSDGVTLFPPQYLLSQVAARNFTCQQAMEYLPLGGGSAYPTAVFLSCHYCNYYNLENNCYGPFTMSNPFEG